MSSLLTSDLAKHAFTLHGFFNDVEKRLNNVTKAGAFPPYDVIVDDLDNPSTYTLRLAVAGYTRENISVQLTSEHGSQLLTIEGTKSDDGVSYFVKQIAARQFSRSFTLAKNTSIEQVKLENGILSIDINVIKEEPANSRILNIL